MTKHKPFEKVQLDATILEIVLVKKDASKKRPWRVQIIDNHCGKRLGDFVWGRPSRHVIKKALGREPGSD